MALNPTAAEQDEWARILNVLVLLTGLHLDSTVATRRIELGLANPGTEVPGYFHMAATRPRGAGSWHGREQMRRRSHGGRPCGHAAPMDVAMALIGELSRLMAGRVAAV